MSVNDEFIDEREQAVLIAVPAHAIAALIKL